MINTSVRGYKEPSLSGRELHTVREKFAKVEGAMKARQRICDVTSLETEQFFV
jgi:hypothetical protein